MIGVDVSDSWYIRSKPLYLLVTNIFGGAEKKTIQFVVNTLYKKKIKWLSAKIRSCVHLKIDKGPKNTDQICCFNPFWRDFLFILSSGIVFGDFFLYVLCFLNKFSIHVLIKNLDFKCDGSLHSIFCRFLQTFVNHKIWTLRRFFYKVKLFLYGLYCE